MTTGFDGSLYVYDAQNRLLTANKAGASMAFTYDGLNRQISRAVSGNTNGLQSGSVFSVWDGWNLIEEYQSGNSVVARYLYGPDGVLKNLTNGSYYYRDGSGSTSYLADGAGNLLEFYLYDLQGTPKFFDGDGNGVWDSAYGVRHLFTGQQWYSDIGLYDLRNRFYSPDIGRFVQPDPIGFWGDRTNLYRYCGNNSVTRWDPVGLQGFHPSDGSGATPLEPVVVTGSDVPFELWDIPDLLQRPPDLGPLERFGSGNPGSGGDGGPGGGGGRGGGNSGSGQHTSASGTNSTNPQQPPPQNPPSASNLSSLGFSPALQALVVTLPSGEQIMPMTLIKNRFQAAVLQRPVYSGVPYFVPGGIDPQAIVNRFAGTTFPSNSLAFYKAFNPWTGSMNFKVQNPIFDSFANFIYGWSGTVGGYNPYVLQGAGYVTHSFSINEINAYDIDSGIVGAMMGGTLSVVPVSDSGF
jgi:RHS repeat-associated protein